MVSIYGLNERLGNVSFYDSQGRDSFTKPYSEDTARVIDEEVSKLIESQYQRALQILSENQAQLTELAEQLLATEVIFKEDLERIFGKRQWESEELVETEVKSESENESENDSESGVKSESENEIQSENESESGVKEDSKSDSGEETEAK
jgi:cell division protease FtsH